LPPQDLGEGTWTGRLRALAGEVPVTSFGADAAGRREVVVTAMLDGPYGKLAIDLRRYRSLVRTGSPPFPPLGSLMGPNKCPSVSEKAPVSLGLSVITCSERFFGITLAQVLVAGGIGITPMTSILAHIRDQKKKDKLQSLQVTDP
jgi:hypothetical protein